MEQAIQFLMPIIYSHSGIRSNSQFINTPNGVNARKMRRLSENNDEKSELTYPQIEQISQIRDQKTIHHGELEDTENTSYINDISRKAAKPLRSFLEL
jgi:hypothetical protein